MYVIKFHLRKNQFDLDTKGIDIQLVQRSAEHSFVIS